MQLNQQSDCSLRSYFYWNQCKGSNRLIGGQRPIPLKKTVVVVVWHSREWVSISKEDMKDRLVMVKLM